MPRRSFKMSLLDALSGIWHCVRTQRNMQIHAAVAVLVLAAAWLLQLDRLEWTLVVFAIGFVVAAEMFNTAVETTVDLCVSTYHPLARLAKHIAAGAVLVAALSAAAVGALIFLPHLYMLFK